MALRRRQALEVLERLGLEVIHKPLTGGPQLSLAPHFIKTQVEIHLGRCGLSFGHKASFRDEVKGR